MRYDPDGNPIGHLDQISLGLSRLLDRYKDKPLIAAWLRSYLQPVQTLEDTLWEMFTERFLDTAQGVQLDTWGKDVGEPRNGVDDPTYRIRIRIRVLVNRSQGTAPNLLEILFRGSGVASVFGLDIEPGTLWLQLNAPPVAPSTTDMILVWLRLAKAAGVRLWFAYPVSSDPGLVVSSSRGAPRLPGIDSTVHPGTGGRIYSVR